MRENVSAIRRLHRHALHAPVSSERSGYADGERWTPADMTDSFEPLASADGSTPSGGLPQTTTTKYTTMAQYRKKPVVIEAEQFTTPQNLTPDSMFMEFPVVCDDKGPHLIIPTLEGNHRADPGDWIITGVKGEKYPCKPEIFEMTYEAA